MGLQQNGFVAVALSVRGDHPPNALQPKLPDGIHLRWGFERSHGFPWYGVYLFRRPHSAADRQRRVANVAGVSMRLVAMRNWRPEKERAEVDGIVRKARAAGVDCAQWEAGSTETILATAIDGAATQGFLLVSPAGRKKTDLVDPDQGRRRRCLER